MTGTELKDLLDSVANTLDAGKKIFPVGLDEQLISILMNLDDTSMRVIAGLLNMSATDFQKLLPDIVNVLKGMRDLFATDESVKISSFCRTISTHPWLLAAIAKFI